MPRIKFIGEPAQALATGPFWEPGDERDLSDAEAAPYLTNANFVQVGPAPLASSDAAAPPPPDARPAPAIAASPVPAQEG